MKLLYVIFIFVILQDRLITKVLAQVSLLDWAVLSKGNCSKFVR